MRRKKRTEVSPFTIGHVYIMTSPYQPNKVKIGYTTRSVYERAEQLTKRLGIEMNVVHFVSRSHIKDLESDIHRFLSKYRCRFNGIGGAYSEEGFCITINQAIQIVESISKREICISGITLPKDVNIEEYIKKLRYDYNCKSNEEVERYVKEEMKSLLVFIIILIFITSIIINLS